MQFVFNEKAGEKELGIKGEQYKYLVKIRRHKAGEMIALRNPHRPELLYHYRIESIDGRRAHLVLKQSASECLKAKHPLHIGWCVIDPKSVERVLPMLNELGVAKITFIYCRRSQKSFRPDFRRFERIAESSMQQCGRSERMKFELMEDLGSFLNAYPKTAVLDFCDDVLEDDMEIETVLIGCEGGFSEEERELFSSCKTVRLDTPMILRSESAAVAIAAKILL